MPLLFVILIGIAIRSLTLPGASKGLGYLLRFDPSYLTPKLFLTALGQAFLSLSIGQGIMYTYGSYLSDDENILKSTLCICGMDTLVAFIAAFAIIPAVFATGIEPGQGGSFAFVSLATVFQSIPGGTVVGFLFYLLLSFAALTSLVSLFEVGVAFLTEQYGLKRKKCTCVFAFSAFLIGILYTGSQGYWNIKGIWIDASGISYPNLCDFMEYFTDRLLIPLGSLALSIFVGWIWKPINVIEEMTKCGNKFSVSKIWAVMIKFVVPVFIFVIFLGELGVF